jgi:hypothetical protein
VELLTDDVQGAQGVLKENDERLEHGGESHTRESALDKPNVQDDHSNVQDAHHVQGAQDEHLEQEITRAPAEAPLSAEQWEDV